MTTYTLAQLKAARASRTVVTLTAGFPGHIDSIHARLETKPSNQVYDVRLNNGGMHWTTTYRVAV